MKPASSSRRLLAAAVSLVCAAVAGCAAAPPLASQPKTTVILMPDADGKVGSVSVSTDAGSQTIDEAFEQSTVDAATTLPSAVAPLGRDAVEAAHPDLLKAMPSKPAVFVLNFLLDKTVLTDESNAMLAAVIEAARERKPTEITVFGHADASGTPERNLKLSAERARHVADLLMKSDPALDRIEVQFFGDTAPLVPTAAGVREPRNRRAEVMIL